MDKVRFFCSIVVIGNGFETTKTGIISENDAVIIEHLLQLNGFSRAEGISDHFIVSLSSTDL